MSVCHKASFLSVRLLALNSHAQPKCLFSLGDEFSILDPGILTQNPIICKTALVQFVQVETVKSYSFIFSHVTIWVINRPTALTTYKKRVSAMDFIPIPLCKKFVVSHGMTASLMGNK